MFPLPPAAVGPRIWWPWFGYLGAVSLVLGQGLSKPRFLLKSDGHKPSAVLCLRFESLCVSFLRARYELCMLIM